MNRVAKKENSAPLIQQRGWVVRAWASILRTQLGKGKKKDNIRIIIIITCMTVN